MNKKYLLILPALILAILLTTDSVSAFSGKGFFKLDKNITIQNKRWEKQSNQSIERFVFSKNEMKGNNFKDLAKEKGISEEELHAKIKIQRQDQQKTFLQNLVFQGKISQMQADARLEQRQEMGEKRLKTKRQDNGDKRMNKNCPSKNSETVKK